METRIITTSVEETEALGRRISRYLQGHENILLIGELGVGKTALARGIAHGLGVEGAVKSPTYTYLKEYQLPRRSTRLAHFDLYRLSPAATEDKLGVTALEVLELLQHNDVISLIEWPDRLPQLASLRPLSITITSIESPEEQREISLPTALRQARHQL